MTYKTLRMKLKTWLIVSSVLMVIFTILSCGSVIVHGDYLKALDALQKLERTGVLPPETDPFLVDIIKSETDLWGGNSEGLKKYIKPMEKSSIFLGTCLVSVTMISFFLLFLRLYFRKSKFLDVEKVTWKIF